MAATKAALAVSRLALIKAAVMTLEREIEDSEGSHKEMLEKWLARVHETLRKSRR
jgi:hypothetical protein